MPFDWRSDGRTLLLLTAAYIAALAISFDAPRFEDSLHEAFALLQWYAREHVVLCLLPALLFAGVLVAGFLLGRPGHEGVIPSAWVAAAVGGNSLASNAFAAFAGAFMYFATLTEIPIAQALLGVGMGKGPGRW